MGGGAVGSVSLAESQRDCESQRRAPHRKQNLAQRVSHTREASVQITGPGFNPVPNNHRAWFQSDPSTITGPGFNPTPNCYWSTAFDLCNKGRMSEASVESTEPVRLTSYQKYVVFCAWVGLGFDLMDSILFNFISPIAVPNLLGLSPTSLEAKAATGFWTGILTSVMLLGWAIGGVAFGRLSDIIGRTRTVIATMLLFSLGTGACALAPNVWVLAVLRFVTALGIGGEWAAGATLVAETVPEQRRVQMGTVLFTSPPFFVFIALFVNWLFTKQIDSIASNPNLSWRLLLAFGAIPAIAAIFIRRGLKESERWKSTDKPKSSLAELFSPELRRRTMGGVLIATVALITFWVVSAFLPVVASFLADEIVPKPANVAGLKASFATQAMGWFNFGGLIGSVLAAPLALGLGRRRMYYLYFLWGAVTVGLAFGLPLER